MKRNLFTIILAFLVAFGVNAQNKAISGYTFVESVGTFTSINTTGTAITPSSWDDGFYNIDLSGTFVFNYNSIPHSIFSINTNGAFKFGSNFSSSTQLNDLESTTNYSVIAACWDDMRFYNDGASDGLFYQLEGSSGSQILTLEWYNITNYGEAGEEVSFQVKLYEATGVFEIIYGDMSKASNWLYESVSIGFNDSESGATVFQSVTPGSPATVSNITANNSIGETTLAAIVTGTSYTFTPPTALAIDATISAITSPLNNFIPGANGVIVNLQNKGTTDMTACNIDYEVYDLTNSATIINGTYNWTGNLTLNAIEEVTLVNFTAVTTVEYRITATTLLAGDEDNTNDEQIQNFTCANIYPTPFTEDFTSFGGGIPPEDWSKAEGTLTNPTILIGSTSAWIADGFANDGVLGSARINIYNTVEDWLFTPFIDLGATGHGLSIKFDLALTSYSGTTAEALGDNDKFVVVISTDGGITWSETNSILTYDNTHTFTTNENVSIDLSSYDGIIQFGFYAERPSGDEPDINLYIDNLVINEGVTLSSEKNILSYTIDGVDGVFTNQDIAIELPYGTDITALVADFTISALSTIAVGTTTQVSGTTDNDFTSSVVYTVTAEDATTQDWTVSVNIANEINILANAIKVYPNPSNGVFNVTINENVSLEVLDVTGKVLSAQNVNSNTTINISNTGVYFLRFSNENGTAVKRVIVK